MERDSLTRGGSDRVSSFLRHPRGREVGGERPRPVWIFCKGQCNFIIIQRVHSLLHTQKVMYAEQCSDLHAHPTRTRTYTCAGIWAQCTQVWGRSTYPPFFTSHTHACPCCHLQAKIIANPKPAQKCREAYHPHPHPHPCTHRQCTPQRWGGTFGGPLMTIPNPLFQGFSHLSRPVHVSPSSG